MIFYITTRLLVDILRWYFDFQGILKYWILLYESQWQSILMVIGKWIQQIHAWIIKLQMTKSSKLPSCESSVYMRFWQNLFSLIFSLKMLSNIIFHVDSPKRGQFFMFSNNVIMIYLQWFCHLCLYDYAKRWICC